VGRRNTQQVARAGEHFVAAELHRRGAYAVTFAGNMPMIDILAANIEQTRTVAIQVKTRSAGTWQTSTRFGRPREPEAVETRFWIFVDLLQPATYPAFYVVPESWVMNDIHMRHGEYLRKHGGTRARSPESSHHSIALARIEQWHERWDLLNIF
jgi:hypothetical protein